MSIEESKINDVNIVSNVVLSSELTYTIKINDNEVFVSGGCTITFSDFKCVDVLIIAKDDASSNNIIIKDHLGSTIHTINTNKGNVRILRDISGDYSVLG